MADYRNVDAITGDLGLDLTNPPDKIPQEKWYSLLNAYPQQNNVLSARKVFGNFFDQGGGAGEIRTIFPVTSEVAFFSTNANNGTIGITNPLVSNFHDLSENWGPNPTYVGTQIALPGGASPFIPYIPPPDPIFNEPSQTWTFVSSREKLRKFAYPPIDSTATLFSELVWGLTGPSFTPTVSLPGSAGGQDSSVSGAEPYTYVGTYFSTLTGAESVPSLPSAEINSTLQSIQVNYTSYTGPFDLQYDSLRWYRKGGTQVSTYRLVATVSAVSSSFVDDKSDDAISTAPPLHEDNFKPFVTTAADGTTLYGTPLPYIWGPFLGQYIFATGDLVDPGKIFWTNPNRPDTMDTTNNLPVTSAQEPLMNGFLYASNSFVFSQQRLFAIDYGGPLSIPTFTAREIPINMGLAVPFGLTVSSLGGVFFVGNDGIYVTDCQGSVESITQESLKPIFRGESANGFSPVNLLDSDGTPSTDIRLFASGQELHFIYKDTSFIRQHLVYNILGKSWRQYQLRDTLPSKITSGIPLGGTESTFLVGLDGNGSLGTKILSYNNNQPAPFNPAEISIGFTARTGGFDMELPGTLKEFGNVIIDADPGGGFTVVPIFNGIPDATVVPTAFTGSGRQKFPFNLGDTYAYFAQLEFIGTGDTKIYGFDWLFRSDQEVLKHWETPESAFGNAGWQHIRDGYFCLRSTSDINLTMTVDGVPHSYVIPSTNNEKRKVYVRFDPVKGKMFRFELDALPNTLNDGLVSFWNLEEATGSVRFDSTGNNNLTDAHNVTQVAGKIDFGAGFLQASNQYLVRTNATKVGLNPGFSDFSYAGWFKGTDIANPLCCGADNNGPDSPGYLLAINVGAQLTVQCAFGVISPNTRAVASAPSLYIPTAWNHIAVTHDRDGVMSLYVNGVLGGTTSIAHMAASPCNPVGDFVLGGVGGNNGATFGFFTGSIDAVGFWSKALTSTEVLQLYNNGFGLQAPINPSSEFRLYGDDTQLNIKPWNTDFGYKPIFPFIAPGIAPFLRKEAGT